MARTDPDDDDPLAGAPLGDRMWAGLLLAGFALLVIWWIPFDFITGVRDPKLSTVLGIGFALACFVLGTWRPNWTLNQLARLWRVVYSLWRNVFWWR